MNILPFRGLLPKLELISNQDHFFENIKEDYLKFRRQQLFASKRAPAFYVFRIQNLRQRATGLICTTHIEDYLQGKILKHEKTIRHKEKMQIELLLERRAAIKPVLLVHQKINPIHQWLQNFSSQNRPVLQINSQDNEQHILWEVTEEQDLKNLRRLYHEKISKVAVGDGHHRLSAFATLWQQASPANRPAFASVLSAYFPEDELNIAAFHRFFELPASADRDKLLDELQQFGSLEQMKQPQLPDKKHQLSVILQPSWYNFAWKTELLKSASEQLPVVDVNLLYQHILKPVLGVEDVQSDPRLHYIENGENAASLIKSIKAYGPGIGFALFPILPADFLKIAQKGIPLVPKATFFQPRLKNGVVVQPIF